MILARSGATLAETVTPEPLTSKERIDQPVRQLCISLLILHTRTSQANGALIKREVDEYTTLSLFKKSLSRGTHNREVDDLVNKTCRGAWKNIARAGLNRSIFGKFDDRQGGAAG